METIIQKNKECYVCATTFNLHSHHILFGVANRKKSEQYGLKVWLCAYHHNMSNESVHQDRELDLHLKRLAQEHYEARYGAREKFISEFGRNYLD